MTDDQSGNGAPSAVGEDSTMIVDTALYKKIAEQKEAQQAYLIVLTGPQVGKTFKLTPSPMHIGRSKDAEFRIHDVGISRMHAVLKPQDEAMFIEDLQSANGTFINGERLELPYRLQDGDKITLGSTTILKFTYHDKLDEDYQRQMFEAALRDGLTKAYNKKYLMTNLSSELAYALRHHTPLSLLLFDIDKFKPINDTFGHLAGDAVLVKLAQVVESAIRAEDLFARYGGEEFAVLCRGIRHGQAAALAERLRRLVAATSFEYNEDLIPVTISIGVAGVPGLEVEAAEELIDHADKALYTAKDEGRNRVRVARPDWG